ncbi:MAG: single-stranded DNA-binding protein [Chloroflexi bacterium]|nr:single-stranded DNA-binding protein [Chloroflexota bacterium]
MAGLCKATIVGYLGSDPEMRYTPAGKPMTTFRVACSSKRRGPTGDLIDETQWFRVVCFNRQAELANEYLARGRLVFVEGRLQSQTWDGQDGQKHFTMEILANEVQFLDSRGKAEGTEAAPAAPRRAAAAAPAAPEPDLEDLPF